MTTPCVLTVPNAPRLWADTGVVQTAEARAAALKEAKLAATRKKSKKGKKGKKQKKNKKKEAEQPAGAAAPPSVVLGHGVCSRDRWCRIGDAYGTVTSMPFFSAGDFDDVDTRLQHSRSSKVSRRR